LQHFATDSAFFTRVLRGSRLDIYSARVRVGFSVLPFTEVKAEVHTAIKLAVIRAWSDRFLLSRGVDLDAYYPKHRDRDLDFTRVALDFPEFATFIPDAPLTEAEVFTAARKEVRYLLHGRGSDAHQVRAQRALRRRAAPPLNLLPRTPAYPHAALPFTAWGGDEAQETADTLTMDATAALNLAFRSTGDTVFGPIMLAVAEHFFRQFGLIPTLYWVFEKQFYPGEYATLLRIFDDQDIEQTDPARFKAMQVDLARKLKTMDAELARLRERADLRNYYDTLFEEAA
jgi:hypothetical protein